MITTKVNLDAEKEKILNKILTEIKEKYKNDIAIVVCYGSCIRGDNYNKSDLDFFFIPETKKGLKMQKQFIINDIGYDFWALSWDRMEKIAELQAEPISIIADGLVCYSAEERCLKRFQEMQLKLKRNLKSSENRKLVIKKAEDLLKEAKSLYFDLDAVDKDYKTADKLNYQILNISAQILALFNSTYIKKAVFNIKEEIKYYEKIPAGFLNYFLTAVKSTLIQEKKNCLKKILDGLNNLLNEEKNRLKDSGDPEYYQGFYEELKSSYNKLINAAQTKDFLAAYFTIHTIEIELKDYLGSKYKQENFPNLINHLINKKYQELETAVNDHESLLLKILAENNVEIIIGMN